MRVRVISIFRDVENFNREYQIGEVCEFDRTRAARLLALGLIEEFPLEVIAEKQRQKCRKTKDKQ